MIPAVPPDLYNHFIRVRSIRMRRGQPPVVNMDVGGSQFHPDAVHSAELSGGHPLELIGPATGGGPVGPPIQQPPKRPTSMGTPFRGGPGRGMY